MDIVIAKPENAPDIVAIEQACFVHPWSLDNVIGSIADANTYMYVAFIDDTTVGYMGVQLFDGEGYITNVATLPQYRRRGVARALISYVLSEHKLDFLTLEVRESNVAAVSLYSSLGFVSVGKRPHFYRDPTEDALLMTKFCKEQ